MSTQMSPQCRNCDDGLIVYQLPYTNHRHSLNPDLHYIYFVRPVPRVVYPLHSYRKNLIFKNSSLQMGKDYLSYMVMKRNTSRLILAATTANPNRMKTKLNATYPGLFISAWSFCSAT